ncbi:MAG TPA: DUF3592 domain-containing protein [Candidatus Acidoferrales bacterium]|nr:DUF3592 domain-containing protein [Candidatus Acidoferrales bacterium]
MGEVRRPISYWSVLGFLFALCTLVMTLKTAIDAYRENRQAGWPTAVATVKDQIVRKTYRRGGDEWHIETEVRYTIGGKELTSNIRSRVGSFGEERNMYRWTVQHPPGTSLPIRYDPEHHETVAPDAGDMPESEPQVPDDVKGTLLFLVLTIVFISIDRVLRRRQLKPA